MVIFLVFKAYSPRRPLKIAHLLGFEIIVPAPMLLLQIEPRHISVECQGFHALDLPSYFFECTENVKVKCLMPC